MSTLTPANWPRFVRRSKNFVIPKSSYEGSAFGRLKQTALSAALAAVMPHTAFAQKPIVIPLEVLRTGHVAVKVNINGKGPFRLALDTGSPVTFVSNACA